MKEIAQLLVKYEDHKASKLTEDSIAAIKSELANFLEKRAGKFLLYNLAVAFFRMAHRASSISEQQREYFAGRKDQTKEVIDLLLLKKFSEGSKTSRRRGGVNSP